MRSQIIISAALTGIIILTVIMIKSVFDIIKAAKKGIMLTALSNKLLNICWGVLGAAGTVFAVYRFSALSNCKIKDTPKNREILTPYIKN